MDIERLDAIGKDVAQAVKRKYGFDEALFVAGVNIFSHHPLWALCLFSKEGISYSPYTIPGEVVQTLVALPERQVIQTLRGMIEEQAQRILNESGTHPRRPSHFVKNILKKGWG
jgi:hypothetical protein